MTDTLKRESAPPAGLIASPIPQYFNPDVGDYEAVEGSDGALFARNNKHIGEEGNAWDGEQTGEDGASNIVDTENLPHVSIMGEVSAATDLSFEVSQDGVKFYFCALISDDISPQAPPGQLPDFPAQFHIFPTVGGRYIRIRSSEDVEATVTIAAKP